MSPTDVSGTNAYDSFVRPDQSVAEAVDSVAPAPEQPGPRPNSSAPWPTPDLPRPTARVDNAAPTPTGGMSWLQAQTAGIANARVDASASAAAGGAQVQDLTYQPALDFEAILALASSVTDGRRFDRQERQALVSAVMRAPDWQLEQLVGLLRPDLTFPQRPANGGQYAPQWVWAADRDFLQQLRTLAAGIRSGEVSRVQQPPATQDALPTSEVAVLLIDAQYEGFAGGWPVTNDDGQVVWENVPEEKQAMMRLLQSAGGAQIPIFPVVWPDRFVTDRDLDSAIPAGATTIQKYVRSAFEGTNLDDKLRERGVRKLVVAGSFEDECVLATVRDALRLGYEVYLHPSLMQGHLRAGAGLYQGLAGVHYESRLEDLPVFASAVA